MALLGKKKQINVVPKLKTMDDLVTSFTSEAQKISDAQGDIESRKNEEIIRAETARDAARKEKNRANIFIKNFTALAEEDLTATDVDK